MTTNIWIYLLTSKDNNVVSEHEGLGDDHNRIIYADGSILNITKDKGTWESHINDVGGAEELPPVSYTFSIGVAIPDNFIGLGNKKWGKGYNLSLVFHSFNSGSPFALTKKELKNTTNGYVDVGLSVEGSWQKGVTGKSNIYTENMMVGSSTIHEVGAIDLGGSFGYSGNFYTAGIGIFGFTLGEAIWTAKTNM